jgi:hypothetical protein
MLQISARIYNRSDPKECGRAIMASLAITQSRTSGIAVATLRETPRRIPGNGDFLDGEDAGTIST